VIAPACTAASCRPPTARRSGSTAARRPSRAPSPTRFARWDLHIDVYRLGQVEPAVPIEETVGAIGKMAQAATCATSVCPRRVPTSIRRPKRPDRRHADRVLARDRGRDPVPCRKLGIGTCRGLRDKCGRTARLTRRSDRKGPADVRLCCRPSWTMCEPASAPSGPSASRGRIATRMSLRPYPGGRRGSAWRSIARSVGRSCFLGRDDALPLGRPPAPPTGCDLLNEIRTCGAHLSVSWGGARQFRQPVRRRR
jgi:hypothetical protein